MKFGWFVKRRTVRRRRPTNAKHYAEHKEHARILVHERLTHWNQLYNFTYKRVAIRNQRSRWGSCSTKQNLNFNYRLVFLPIELVDYVIVHELCHLKHFNHSETFWSEVEKQIPDYRVHKKKLHEVSKNMHQHMSTNRRGQTPTISGQQISEVSATVPG